MSLSPSSLASLVYSFPCILEKRSSPVIHSIPKSRSGCLLSRHRGQSLSFGHFGSSLYGQPLILGTGSRSLVIDRASLVFPVPSSDTRYGCVPESSALTTSSLTCCLPWMSGITSSPLSIFPRMAYLSRWDVATGWYFSRSSLVLLSENFIGIVLNLRKIE